MNQAQKIASAILILALAGIFMLVQVLGFLLFGDKVRSIGERLPWAPILAVAGFGIAIAGLVMWRWAVGGRLLDRERLTTLTAIVTAGGFIFAAWMVLIGYVRPDSAEERTNVAQIAVGIVGGTVLGIGGYVGWRSLQVTRARLDLDRESQLTENFTAAVEQLGATLDGGAPNYEVRLGGIYALERIAKSWVELEKANDYWAVIEVLTAYLRHNTREERVKAVNESQDGDNDSQSRFMPDIEVIVDVIRRRPGIKNENRRNFRLDLRGCWLKGAIFSGAQLKRANFRDAQLERASFVEARLQGANLSGAQLEGAYLSRAQLERAILAGARLEGATLFDARLDGAILSGTHLEGAFLIGAQLIEADLYGAHLRWADLRGSHLEGADLRGSHLEGADLRGSHLEGADLREAYLEVADLRRVNMEGADLRGAHLEAADLRGAWLAGTDLRGSHLEAAIVLDESLASQMPSLFPRWFTDLDLESVDLRKVYGLTVDALLAAKDVDPDLVPEHLREEYLERLQASG